MVVINPQSSENKAKMMHSKIYNLFLKLKHFSKNPLK